MSRFVRLICIVISLAFATASTVHGFAATNMEIMMSDSDVIAGAENDSCSGCVSGEDSRGNCDQVFSSPMSLVQCDTASATAALPRQVHLNSGERAATGTNPGLDPSPPRKVIL